MASKNLQPFRRFYDDGALENVGVQYYRGSKSIDVTLVYDTHNLNVTSISGDVEGYTNTNAGAELPVNSCTVELSYFFIKIVDGEYAGRFTSPTRFLNDTTSVTATANGVNKPFSVHFSNDTQSSSGENMYLAVGVKLTAPYYTIAWSLYSLLQLSITYETGSSSGPTSVKATPSSPSGTGVSFSTATVFSWSISSIPEGCTYVGTQIQMTYATDTTGSRIFYDYTNNGLATNCTYDGSLQPNTSYIWRTRAIINQSTSSSDTPIYDDGLIIEDDPSTTWDEPVTTPSVTTPWSDWKSFTTNDYEHVSVRVTTTSPEDNASFVIGKDISFRWSISGGSGASVLSSTLMIDGNAFATINGTGTSYTYRGTDGRLNQGSHTWYVTVDISTESNIVLVTDSPSSDRCTFYIDPPTATASPSSPSGSTTVYANSPVQFTWSISKNGDGSYTGSQLEWRYSTEDIWHYLGEAEKGITSYTRYTGFNANTVVQWRVRTSLDDVWPTNGGWSDPMSFSVGSAEIFKATPKLIKPKGTVNGDEIEFAWTVESDAPVTSCKLECSFDGGVTWQQITQIDEDLDTYTYSVTEDSPGWPFPAGSVAYRVCAKANDINYGNYVQSSFEVVYSAYGTVVLESSSKKVSFRQDQQLEIKARLDTVGVTSENITFASASFLWRMASGTEYHEETMTRSGTSATIYLPANKFSVGIMYWYVKAEDSKGNKSETDINASYVLASGVDTFPIDPQSVIHESSDQLVFKWGFIAQNGNLSKKTEVQFSDDGVNYNTPITIDATITSHTVTSYHSESALVENLYTGFGQYTFAADYFSAGRVYWQLRSTSSDGVVGGWSEPALFIVRGIPKIKNFKCDKKPFATFTWTATEQSSYMLVIDETLYYGPFHGDASRFTLPEPLDNGTHTAALQIENYLGAKSDFSRVSFKVRNVPSTASLLNLLISAATDAVLQWSPVSVSSDNEFLVYRDTTLIARLESSITRYRDRLALGTHTYKVIQRLSNNYYDTYVHAPVALHTSITKIGLLDGEMWLDLILTKEPYPSNDFTHKRILAKNRIMGAKYPVIEVSEFEEKGGSYTVCWPFENYAQTDLFNMLVGQAIVVKSRADMVLCGVLEGCDLSVNSQYIECTFSLDQMSTDTDLSIAAKKSDFLASMTDLDSIYFGQLTAAQLRSIATNPGYTDPKYYEEISEAINEVKDYIQEMDQQ